MMFPSDVGEKLLDLFLEFEQLFLYKSGEHYFIYRQLNVSELRCIEKTEGKLMEVGIQDWIVGKALLLSDLTKEEILHTGLPGYASNLADAIMKSSMLDEQGMHDLADSERNKAERIDNGLINRYLFTYKVPPESSKELTIHQLIGYGVWSEILLDREFPLGNKKQKPKHRNGPVVNHTVDSPNEILSENMADDPLADMEGSIFDDFK